jgi:hypothetical protein
MITTRSLGVRGWEDFVTFVLIGVLALIMCGCAREQPIKLSCTGETWSLGTSEKYTALLTVDLKARAVAFEGYKAVPILGDTEKDVLVFTDSKVTDGVSSGSLNRMTGVVSVRFVFESGLHRFDGICKPAQKLF